MGTFIGVWCKRHGVWKLDIVNLLGHRWIDTWWGGLLLYSHLYIQISSYLYVSQSSPSSIGLSCLLGPPAILAMMICKRRKVELNFPFQTDISYMRMKNNTKHTCVSEISALAQGDFDTITSHSHSISNQGQLSTCITREAKHMPLNFFHNTSEHSNPYTQSYSLSYLIHS